VSLWQVLSSCFIRVSVARESAIWVIVFKVSVTRVSVIMVSVDREIVIMASVIRVSHLGECQYDECC
jgi:hypothetical protein